METKDYVIFDFGKVIIDYKTNKYYKEIEGKLYNLTPDEQKQVEKVVEIKDGVTKEKIKKIFLYKMIMVM